ncbi:MAG: PIN domain-containing protein [Paracoccus sp. (in: a-proteobacteria)]|uniref:RSP_2648 family PIN domain-containing protein n=1 Tax=Paracoccus sp. TaxID=267 RepID=UPI0026DEA832|nr:PIN domain-containing protein [Paracoccus sp. (in: a-proteobacteria)]MDO5621595.1 PIN domain-containing protein [Paracoccus sp. (in: a-proteobacteria)]
MRAVLDACVLFPTVLREILTETAAAGAYSPLWSQRILDEWTGAAHRLGADQARVAGVEAALLADRFPAAMVRPTAIPAADLPDSGDLHVLAAAISGDAQLIVTANLRDFPRRVLADYGLRAIHPDAFLLDLPAVLVAPAVASTHARVLAAGGDMTPREMLKRARLPRLARALAAQP